MQMRTRLKLQQVFKRWQEFSSTRKKYQMRDVALPKVALEVLAGRGLPVPGEEARFTVDDGISLQGI